MAPIEAIQLQSSYHNILDRLSALNRLVSRPLPSSQWQDDVRHEVQSLRQELATHYELLDIGDYLDEVEHLCPGMHDQLVRLHREQELILEEIEEISSELAASRGAIGVSTLAQLRLLLTHIQDHEDRKNRLVLEAFNSEAGAAD
jgi:uncharacterized coiled-coil DUF342 family protein